jgi:hypothetical protein
VLLEVHINKGGIIVAKGKKIETNIKEFEGFKIKLGKYLTNTRPPGKTKLEAATELNASLSKYNAYEDPSNEFGRQTIPLDLLFTLAKRDRTTLLEIIQKIDLMDKKTNTNFEKSSKDKVIQKIVDTISRTSRDQEIFDLYNLFHKMQSEFPKEDPINNDPELWVIYLLKNILLLNTEDFVELIYSVIKKINQKKKANEISEDIDLSFNENFMRHTINQFIKHKKKEFIDNKTLE